MRFASILAFLFVLSGCADGALGRRGSPAWSMTAPESAKREFFTGVCLDKGYQLNTPEMQACIRSEPRSVSATQPLDASERRLRELERRQERLDSARRTECILSGGSYGGGQCFNY